MSTSGCDAVVAVGDADGVHVSVTEVELCAQNQQRLCLDMVEMMEEVAGSQFSPAVDSIRIRRTLPIEIVRSIPFVLLVLLCIALGFQSRLLQQ